MAQSFDKMAFKVGLFVLAVFLTAMASIVYIGIKKELFSETVTFYVITDSGERIERGIPVRISGFDIGQVEKINLDSLDHVTMEISILAKYTQWLREGTKVILEQEGIIGNSYLKVIPGSEENPELAPESIIEMSKIGGVSELLEKSQPVMENIMAIVANVKQMTDIFVEENGTVQRILNNLETMSAKLSAEDGLIHYVSSSPEPVTRVRAILDQADIAARQTNKALVQAETLMADATARMEDLEPAQRELLSLMIEAREILSQLDGLRDELRPTIRNIEALTGNVKNATSDLVTLRRKTEYTLRLGTELLERLNTTWPLNRDTGPKPAENWPAP